MIGEPGKRRRLRGFLAMLALRELINRPDTPLDARLGHLRSLHQAIRPAHRAHLDVHQAQPHLLRPLLPLETVGPHASPPQPGPTAPPEDDLAR